MFTLLSSSLLISLVDYVKALVSATSINSQPAPEPTPDVIKEIVSASVESVLRRVGYTEEAVREYEAREKNL